MMPANVRYVFLSASIENPEEFARWIVRLRKYPCHVISTEKRPTPLQHYLCPLGGQGIYQVVDKNGNFNRNILKKAIETVEQNLTVVGLEKQKRKKNIKVTHLSKAIKLIK